MKKSVYYIIVTALLLLVPYGVFSQGSTGGSTGGLRGVVISRENKQPLAEVTVTLLTPSPQTTVTNAQGEFTIENAVTGSYVLEITANEYTPVQINVKVENYEKNLGNVSLVPLMETGNASQDVPIEFDTETSDDGQSLPMVLTSSKDVFDNIAGYRFGEIRFRHRGYDNSAASVYLNGVYFNDALTGYSPWSLWSGLNEATRNQELTTGIAPSAYGLGGISGTTNINARASQMRKGYRFSLVNASGQYRLRLMGTYASGEQDNGWSYALSFSRRVGGNNWVNGVYYDAYAYFASVEKKINDENRLSLTILGAPAERGAQTATTQEVYDLTGSNYYNANWGYQNGEIRNARIRNNHEPVAMLNYYYTPNDKVNLLAAFSYRFGRNGYSSIDWYDAPDPRPDYYRNLPSYYPNDPIKAGYAREGWLTDWNIRQVNWDQMYNINYNTFDPAYPAMSGSRRSQYVLQESRVDQNDFNWMVQTNLQLNNHHKLNVGTNIRLNSTENYKVMKDLLGGDYFVDIDKFAERDFVSGDAAQNDLDNPNRIIQVGDKYGYNYRSHVVDYKLWVGDTYTHNNIEAYAALEGGQTKLWRDGIYRKGLFPDNSEGNSEKLHFWNYTAKAGLTYKLSRSHRIYANIAAMEKAPYFKESFLSPRTRNTIAPNLTTEKTYSADINYAVNYPFLKARLTGFYTQIKDKTKTISFYDDINSAYTNFSMSGIDQLNTGVELGLSVPIFKGLSADAAFSYGYYIYNSNPYVTQTLDNSNAILLENERVYWDKYKVAGTPQTAVNAGLNYKSSKYLFVGVNLCYYDAMYLDMNPLYRTDYAHAGLTPEQSQVLAHQERFDPAYTLSANIGKSWYIKDKYNLGFSFEMKNILNNQNIKTGGYEQMRLKTNPDGTFSRFDSKYFYMFGPTYYLNIYLRF